MYIQKKARLILLLTILLLCGCTLVLTVAAVDHSDDDTPPVLYGVAVSRRTVAPGESILVSVDAEDDESGIQSVEVRFRNSAGDVLSARLLRNSDEDIDLPYSGTLSIPQSVSGAFSVSSVLLTDREDNRSVYSGSSGEYPLTGQMQASFTVTGTGVAPVLQECSVQKDAAGAIAIRVGVKEGSVPVKSVNLLFENSENHRKLSFTLEEEDLESGIYQKQFLMPSHEPSGVFVLRKLTVKDLSAEKTVWSTMDEEEDHLPLTLSASFNVSSSVNDTEDPVLHSITVGSPVRDDDETRYRLTVKAEDALSGIEHITVKFQHTVTGSTASKVLRESDRTQPGVYSGYLVLDDDDDPGTWMLDSITVADRAGNRITCCRPEDVTDRKLPLPQVPVIELR